MFRTIEEMKMNTNHQFRTIERNENDTENHFHSFRTIEEMKMTIIIRLEQ